MQVRRGHQGIAGGIRALQGTLHLLTFGIARADRGKRYALARCAVLGVSEAGVRFALEDGDLSREFGQVTKSLPGVEVRVEDKSRKNVTVVEAAEYLGLTRSTVQEMVDRGVLKADEFAGAVHIPREEVERIERETAP